MRTFLRVGMTKAGLRPLRRPMIHIASSLIRNTWGGGERGREGGRERGEGGREGREGGRGR